MYINFQSIQNKVFYFKDQFLSSITPQQKKILIIAAAAFSCIAAIYFSYIYFFTVKTDPKGPKIENKEEKKIDKKPSDDKSASDKKVENKPAENLNVVDKKEEHQQTDDTNKEDVQKDDVINDQEDALNKQVQEEDPKIAAAKKAQEEENAKAAAAQKTQEEENAKIAPAKKAQDEEDAKEVSAQKAHEKDVTDRKAQKIVNVLMAGRSRSGKTTLMNMLQDPFHIPPDMNLFFSTVQPQETEIKLNGYTFRVLDTPGLFEIAEIDSKTKARSNEEIAQLIETEVCKVFGGQGFENIDAVIFTNSLAAGISTQDVESIKFFLPKFAPDTKKLFVVTRSDLASDVTCEKIKTDCSKHPALANHIQNEFGGTIFLSGTLQPMDLVFRELALARLDRINDMREVLIDALLPDSLTKDEREEFRKQRLEEVNGKLPQFVENIPEQQKSVRSLKLPKQT